MSGDLPRHRKPIAPGSPAPAQSAPTRFWSTYPKAGLVYLIRHTNYPGWVNAGRSKTLKRINAYTNYHPFGSVELIKHVETTDAMALERFVHMRLDWASGHEVDLEILGRRPRDEWFKIDSETALATFDQAVAEFRPRAPG